MYKCSSTVMMKLYPLSLHYFQVVAMKHLTEVYEGEPFNFEMVYREYTKFCHRRSSMQSYERPVIFKAFDQLKVNIYHYYWVIFAVQRNRLTQ